MTFQQAIATCLTKYADVQGRGSRSEYWYFFLFNLLMHLATGLLDAGVFGESGLLNGLWSLAVLIPGIAAGVRRLHDTNRSGWWLLIPFIPLVGAIILIIWLARPGDAGPNRFGAAPLQAAGFAPA